MRNRSAAAQGPPSDLGTRVIRVLAWLSKAKYTHGAIVIVRNDNGDLLLVQERFRERGAWGLPGGFMRQRETPRQAAVRELGEEVGIQLAEASLEAIDAYHQPWARHYDHLFALSFDPAHTSSGTSRELRGKAWFAVEQLPPLTRAAEHALARSGLTAGIDQPAGR